MTRFLCITIFCYFVVLIGIYTPLPAKTLPAVTHVMTGSTFVGVTAPSGGAPLATLNGYFNSAIDWTVIPANGSPLYYLRSTLELNHIESPYLVANQKYDLTITGRLHTYKIGSVTADVSNITLSIHFDPQSQTNDRTKDYIAFFNCYKAEFEVLSATISDPLVSGSDVSKWVDLRFTFGGQVFRKPDYTTIPTLNTTCVDPESNELVINWNPVDFAEEYELEFTFRDNYSSILNAGEPFNSLAFDFKRNATRIVTANTYYRVPLVYERGYLGWRIRAVGKGGADWSKRLPCKWSAPDQGFFSALTNNTQRYGPIAEHVDGKINWQLNTSYAEGGKRKDLVEYSDGLSRIRQTVTGVSQLRTPLTTNILDGIITPPRPRQFDLSVATTRRGSIPITTDDLHPYLPFPNADCRNLGRDKIKEIIAQETIYDFNGRPGVKIMPAPTGTHKITYIKKLNRNLAGQSYSWEDFDVISNCELPTKPLNENLFNNTLGAASYYSPKNPNKVGYNAFIPDSRFQNQDGGYPFSRVEYTRDNTGKIFRQGGVGKTLQLGEGHETKFYYGKPNQVELDRMFGNDVGYALRYQKNLIVDPNGQASVSYLNPEGKTIATALAGPVPTNLLPIDHVPQTQTTVYVDLIPSNTRDYDAHTISVTEQFVVPADGDYTFDYTIRGEKLTYEVCEGNSICLDCIYDLDISLVHNEACSSETLIQFSGTIGELISNEGRIQLDQQCIPSTTADPGAVNLPTDFPLLTPATRTLERGSYTLTKVLKINDDAIESYVQEAFKDTCDLVLGLIYEDELSRIDTSDCFQSCDSCKAETEQPLPNCAVFCPEPLNECERAREMMLRDMSPGGQYGEFSNTGNGYSASGFPLSFFNPNNSLPFRDAAGQPMDWTDIPQFQAYSTLQDLIQNWDPTQHPQLIVRYHPEACMLDWCDLNSTAFDYDLNLRLATTLDQATSQNLISLTGLPLWEQLVNNDPFFAMGGPAAAQKTSFIQFLTNICSFDNLVRVAMRAAYCQHQAEQQGITSDAFSAQPFSDALEPQSPDCAVPTSWLAAGFGQDPATKDLQWRMLRNLYLTYKERYVYQNRLAYSVQNKCYNGCIGTDDFFVSPFSVSIPPHGTGNLTVSQEGIQPVWPLSPCLATAHLYDEKVKRFTNRYDAFAHLSDRMSVSIAGIDLYNPCARPEDIDNIRGQIGDVVDQYICPDSTNCSLEQFASILNNHLSQVRPNSPIILQKEDVPVGLTERRLTRFQITYIDPTTYSILLAGKGWTDSCILRLRGDSVRSRSTIAEVCCPSQNGETWTFVIKYSDGTKKVATLDCGKLLPCVENAFADSCKTLTPFARELSDFLLSLSRSTTPRQGIYRPSHSSTALYPRFSSDFPISYSIDPRNCSLTFSGLKLITSRRVTVISGTRSRSRIELVKKLDTVKCTIRFSNCSWISRDKRLISIKPASTTSASNQFILTFLGVGLREDTLRVIATSNCGALTECHEPYFCNDTFIAIPPNNFDGCIEAQIRTAELNTRERYGRWVDSMKNDLREKYYAKCMSTFDSLGYEYDDRQYHYTLYYFDQASNLVRTVPPGGVNLLSTSQVGLIDAARENPSLAGVYPQHGFITNYSYNSLNKVTWQETPDAGKSIFFHDKLGRIAASQNAEQALTNAYSYTYYDLLGRVVESGKLSLGGILSQSTVDNYQNWKNYLLGNSRSEITYSQYDRSFGTVAAVFGPIGQNNLRGRISSVLSFKDGAAQSTGAFRHGTHYTYDASGGVTLLIQDYPNTPVGVKSVAYNYDLVSGKVNEVRYQPNASDEFRHKFTYDDELRLIRTETSKKGIVWQTNAEYQYYKHGLIARKELGDLKVQGIDYLYTLQGWKKGVNGADGTVLQDAGRDGTALVQLGPGQIVSINGNNYTVFEELNPNLNSRGLGYNSLHRWVASDAYSYLLSYYAGDYTPIEPTVDPRPATLTNTSFESLYSGNIGQMYTWLKPFGSLGMNYRYDQLSRFKSQKGFTVDATGVVSPVQNDGYGMNVSYDLNGNIITMLRNGQPGNVAMDTLTYHYYDKTGATIASMSTPPLNATNRLAHVDDLTPAINYPEATPVNGTTSDIDDQQTLNFQYDKIGNVIKDNAEGISIAWNQQNKLSSIQKTDGSTISYDYDALGARIRKAYNASTSAAPKETYYIRDAQDNVLCIYETTNGSLRIAEHALYGTNRIGILNQNILAPPAAQSVSHRIDWLDLWANYETNNSGRLINIPDLAFNDSLVRGVYQYELTNHIENVLATVSDQISTAPASPLISGIQPDIVSANDYYPFGSQAPSRVLDPLKYRYGFNAGSELDNDISDKIGKYFTTEFREGDAYLGRWLSLDPAIDLRPWQSPYCSMDNNPILSSDPNGDIIPIILGIWAVAEVAMTAYDVYEAGSTLTDKNATTAEKASAAGGLLIGAVLPGGGYGTAAKQVVKQVEKKIVKETAEVVEKKVVKKTTEHIEKKAVKVAKDKVEKKATKSVKDDPLARRAKLRGETKKIVKEKALKTDDGRFIDPNTRLPIEKGQEVFGHKPGHEWHNYKKDPANKQKTRKEVVDDQNDPDIYQIEDKKSNESHKHEKK